MDRERVALLAFPEAFDDSLVRQMGLDSRKRDRAVDRLGQVIVGAKAEGFDDVRPAGAGGQHDDR